MPHGGPKSCCLVLFPALGGVCAQLPACLRCTLFVLLGVSTPLFPEEDREVAVPTAQTFITRALRTWRRARTNLMRHISGIKSQADRRCRPAPPLHGWSEGLALIPRHSPLFFLPQAHPQIHWPLPHCPYHPYQPADQLHLPPAPNTQSRIHPVSVFPMLDLMCLPVSGGSCLHRPPPTGCPGPGSPIPG